MDIVPGPQRKMPERGVEFPRRGVVKPNYGFSPLRNSDTDVDGITTPHEAQTSNSISVMFGYPHYRRDDNTQRGGVYGYEGEHG